eukprot:01068.XXX_2260_3474_1 [CDS] Oithona nana genome sequencing.
MQKVRQYFENTSLHGPKYITEYGRHFIEKIFWLIVVIAATILGVYLTIRIVDKWNQTPILTSISTTNYPLHQIPFPAVTICPNTKGLRGKIVHEICRQNWTEKMDPDQVLLSLYNSVSPILGTDYEFDNHTDDPLGLNITETISLLKRVSPRCSDYILQCTWNSVKYHCNQLFKVASTDVGFCCSFNLVPPNQILSNSNKTTDVFEQKYIAGHGLDKGLSILIDSLVCEFLSNDFFDGLKVYVHNSDTFPEVGQRGFIIDKGTVNYVALNAYITQSSVNTERYDNLTRGCNFAHERQLKYYKNYTRANCELEAKIDGFKENCGCKPYYFPGD